MRSFLRSVKYALRGIRDLILTERNFRIHLVILALVIAGGIYFSITSIEWMTIISISSVVLGLEAFNTAVERLCDLYSMSEDPRIRFIKDVAAGGVLIAAILAVVIGCIIFIPYLLL